jgi:hypothetical protein
MLAASDGSISTALNPSASIRSRYPLKETYRPPGRGSAITLSWGVGGSSASLTFEYIPSADGDVLSLLEGLLVRATTVYLKWPAPYEYEPMRAQVSNITDNPSSGGLVNITAEFEEVEV